MSETAPAVTVILPVYNVAKYLPEAIDSILAQTFRDFEIVAFNDGSTDSSGEILERYAARDKRIRLARHDVNKGLSRTRTDAFALARGRYVAQQDGDDVSLPTRLQRQVEFLEAHREICAVYCRPVVAGEDLKPLYIICNPVDDGAIRRALPRGNVLQPNFMARTETLRNIGGCREAFMYSGDYDLNLRLVEHGKVHCLPDALYVHRKHSAQMSTRGKAVQDRYGTLAKTFALERRKTGRDSYDDFAAAGSIRRFVRNYRFRYEFYLFAGERILRRLETRSARKYLRRAVRQKTLPLRALWLLFVSCLPLRLLHTVRSLKNRFIDRLGRTAPADGGTSRFSSSSRPME